MSDALATILEDNIGEFADRWRASRPRPQDGEEESGSDFALYLSAYRTLVNAARSGDFGNFLDQLYQEGVDLGSSGVKVSWVVSRILAASRVLRELVLDELEGESRQQAQRLLDQLEERGLSAMLEGYTAG